MVCSSCLKSGHNIRTCPSKLKKCGQKIHPKIKLSPLKSEHQTLPIKENKMCAICFDDINDSITVLKCKHEFCTDCIFQHIITNNKCPLCRRILLEEQIPRFQSLKFIFHQAANNYIASTLGFELSPTWQDELCAIIFSMLCSHFKDKNMRTPPIIDDNGNYSDWIVDLVNDGLNNYYGEIVRKINEAQARITLNNPAPIINFETQINEVNNTNTNTSNVSFTSTPQTYGIENNEVNNYVENDITFSNMDETIDDEIISESPDDISLNVVQSLSEIFESEHNS